MIILDNLLAHHSKRLSAERECLKGLGIEFFFQPPYSPKFNLIESYWRLLKRQFYKEWSEIGVVNLGAEEMRNVLT